jgi:hypothetical protein
VVDDGTEQDPGGERPSLRLRRGSADRAASSALTWVHLKERYRGVQVGLDHHDESIYVRLPPNPDPAAIARPSMCCAPS